MKSPNRLKADVGHCVALFSSLFKNLFLIIVEIIFCSQLEIMCFEQQNSDEKCFGKSQ